MLGDCLYHDVLFCKKGKKKKKKIIELVGLKEIDIRSLFFKLTT